MLWVPESLLSARSWSGWHGRQQRGRNAELLQEGLGAGAAAPPACAPLGQGSVRAAVNASHVRNKRCPAGECRCHQLPPVPALQADLNPQPPKSGHAT